MEAAYLKTYSEAINFCLNYPPGWKPTINYKPFYDEDKDLFNIDILDDGWYSLSLEGKFVRSAWKWINDGKKAKWTK